MRVIAGQLKNAHFDSPPGGKTHPMSEKIRGAIFNALGDISGLTVLDAYAGSGAIGFEALSRGAVSATLVDNDKKAERIITKNIEQLGLSDSAKFIKSGVSSYADNLNGAFFDVIICDPPYGDVRLSNLQKLADLAKPGGIIVFSLPPSSKLELGSANFKLLTSKSYGDATLWFWRRTS